MTATDAHHAALTALAEFGAALSEVSGLETVIDTALTSFDLVLGFEHVLLMIREPESDVLTTIASRGYDVVGIGSEVVIGQGVIGKVAQSRRPMRIGNLQRMLAYLRTVQNAVADGEGDGPTIQLPGLPGARSQVAAPMVANGVLIGVVAAESEHALAFGEPEQLVLTIAGQLVASALEREEILDRADQPEPESLRHPTSAPVRDNREETWDDALASPPAHRGSDRPVHARLRFYPRDGSTFIDDEYVIKGVAGRLLWKLANESVANGRRPFTNREVRRDPALEMPSFHDNFESRLVLLKRRLEERDAPVQIFRSGRGRFDVDVRAPLLFERIDEQ